MSSAEDPQCNHFLFIGELRFDARNGYFSRQEQAIRFLATRGNLDILNLGDTPQKTAQWLVESDIRARVADGWKVSVLRWLFNLWYLTNTVFCNKFQLYRFWKFGPSVSVCLFSGQKYKAAVYYYLWPTQMVKVANDCARQFIDLGDIMADRHARIDTRRWISISPLLEARMIQSCDFTPVAITPNDANECERSYGISPAVVCYSQALPVLRHHVADRRVGYIGAKNNFSDDLVDFLIHSKIIKKLADEGIIFVLAGGVCDSISDRQRQDLERLGVTVLGKVSKISEFYDQVVSVVNLTGPSTGAKIKSIEALIHGKSLVTTPYGADTFTRDFFSKNIFSVGWPLNEQELFSMLTRSVRHYSMAHDFDLAKSYISAVEAQADVVYLGDTK